MEAWTVDSIKLRLMIKQIEDLKNNKEWKTRR
jgi:hypothetical protein